VRYAQRLSAQAVKDLDQMDDRLKTRILDRIAELAEAPYNPNLSIKLTNKGGLRRSRVGDYRIIFLVDDKASVVSVVTIASRGQVYKRI
jgi:mRNA interferase RelE/StbE